MRFKNKYRIESTRLTDWDYSTPGYYLVTLCTKERIPFFGRVEAEKVLLSAAGEIADQFWRRIPEHFIHVLLDEFVIMTNHIHGIIVIDRQVPVGEDSFVETPHVETPHVASQQGTFQRETSQGIPRKFGPLRPGSLSKIIQAYKAAVTREVRMKGDYKFAWQSLFYDHIIRNEKALNKIRTYIWHNPLNWRVDKYFPE